MEALHSLCIDWKILVAQIINFLVLLFLLNKFLYKPIITMLENRRQKIEQGLKDAEQSSVKLNKSNEEAEKIIEKAYSKAGQILDSAKKEAESEASAIITAAKTRSEKIIDEAHKEAHSLKYQALAEAKKQLSEIISLSLSKVLGNNIDQKIRDKLTKDAIREIE